MIHLQFVADNLVAGPGFQNQNAHFNPAFFGNQGNQSSNDTQWNPHGAKRTRQD